MRVKILLVFVASLVSFESFAGRVRKLTVDASEMFPIHLKMGRSTVLTFNEKPKRVVIGNQNYYNLEFVEGTNHITLQPQSTVSTNLFVYGQGKVYGFILHTSNRANYDDLVKIRWKQREKLTKVRGKLLKFTPSLSKNINKSISLGEIKIYVKSITKYRKESYIVDTVISSKSILKQDLKDISVKVKRGRKYFSDVDSFLEKRFLSKNEVAKLRVFIDLKAKRSFSLEFSLNGEKKRAVISKRLLLN